MALCLFMEICMWQLIDFARTRFPETVFTSTDVPIVPWAGLGTNSGLLAIGQ